MQWLADHGINKDRCLAVGFGDKKPIADNKTDDGKAQNRRTEFHIAEIAGKPFLKRDETGGGDVAPGQAAPRNPRSNALPVFDLAPRVDGHRFDVWRARPVVPSGTCARSSALTLMLGSALLAALQSDTLRYARVESRTTTTGVTSR